MKAQQKYDVSLPPYLVWPVSIKSATQIQDWGHEYLKAGEVYGKTRGEGAVVAILDTAGEFAHPDLVKNSLNRYGKNFTDSPSLIDVHGHGTHCAGIAAATDNEIGVIGVAPGAHLLPVKVLNDAGSGAYSWIAAGIRYIADLEMEGELNDLPRIISMSLGGPNSSKILKEAIDYAIGKGCLVVAAAGNEGYREGINNVGYPGKYAEVITIASMGKTGLPSRFSSAGTAVDLAAPGEQVYSTHKNGSYAYLSGTSMATPHVAGVCALILSVFPEIKTQGQLEAFLSDHAKDIYDTGEDLRTGAGVPIVPGYLDQKPGEPEEPTDLEPEPEPEEPTREKRTLLIPTSDSWKVYWKTRSEANLHELFVHDLVVEVTTDRPGPALVDELTALVEKYFTRRGFIVPDHMDYQDAVYYAGIFLKVIVGREIPVEIYRIGGYDPEDRQILFATDAYAGRIKKQELRQANTFAVPAAIEHECV
ncbi:S8 family peptidase [Flavilitoribacter nigricans]|nr:S8 family peptidase [Flavilitoribacter nigricans]